MARPVSRKMRAHLKRIAPLGGAVTAQIPGHLQRIARRQPKIAPVRKLTLEQAIEELG
jgi:hypothetical protein